MKKMGKMTRIGKKEEGMESSVPTKRMKKLREVCGLGACLRRGTGWWVLQKERAGEGTRKWRQD